MTTLTNEELIEIFTHRLPQILDERPELEPQLYHFFLKAFVRKEELAAFQQVVAKFQEETQTNFDQVDSRFDQVDSRFDQVDSRLDKVDSRFDQVDSRFDQVDSRLDKVDSRLDQVDSRFDQVDEEFKVVRTEMADGFKNMTRHIDRLGSRWGIRNESLFRETMAALLEESFGVAVETRDIEGEQFDLIISNGQHILVEITASVGRTIKERLERKRNIYSQATGIQPARFILATTSIHTRRAQALQAAGFEVIEPEEAEGDLIK